MESTTNGEKKVVTLTMILTVCVIDIIISIVWGFGIWDYSHSWIKNILTILGGIPGLLSNVSTFSAAIFGIIAAWNGAFNKGGTKYYTYKYGYRKLKKIVDKYNTYANYDKVVDTIINILLVTKASNSPKTVYYNCVDRLLILDEDFKKVWNDFNYYHDAIKISASVQKYYDKLEKCVFIKVYEKYQDDLSEK